MNNKQSLSYTKWECKYHLTWIPKYRKKALDGDLRNHLGEVLRALAQRRECKILEGHLMSDHAHMLISIPPKYAVVYGLTNENQYESRRGASAVSDRYRFNKAVVQFIEQNDDQERHI